MKRILQTIDPMHPSLAILKTTLGGWTSLDIAQEFYDTYGVNYEMMISHDAIAVFSNRTADVTRDIFVFRREADNAVVCFSNILDPEYYDFLDVATSKDELITLIKSMIMSDTSALPHSIATYLKAANEFASSLIPIIEPELNPIQFDVDADYLTEPLTYVRSPEVRSILLRAQNEINALRETLQLPLPA